MDQVVVHIDLDFFYGQVEQAANPSLIALPFAIQQKHIVVTCNYLARAAGVRKLQLLTDAKKACPNLIIVNGEDIQRYRDASKAVFRHVRSLVGEKVQRLGMDELWLDVTEHVTAHYESRSEDTAETAAQLEFVYQDTITFHYPTKSISGHCLGDFTSSRSSQLLQIASHLAAFLRESIRSRFSFTSSAGVSTSKLVAKLVGDFKKPNDQTCIMPDYHQTYLDNIEIKKIAGVGYKMLKVLYANLPEMPRPDRRSVEGPRESPEVDDLLLDQSQTHALEHEEADQAGLDMTDDGDEFKLISKQKEEFFSTNKRHLTVFEIRSRVTKEALTAWLGHEQGLWLWSILHAKDDSVVVPSSLYPKSIGVEDSFLHCVSLSGVRTHLLDLTRDLLHRVESDLKENGRYVRSPTSLRLTPRFRGDQEKVLWKHKRTSRSVPFPVDALREDVTLEVRTQNLVDKALLPLFKRIVEEWPNWDLSLINVGVADFKMSGPVTSITEYLETNETSKKRKLESTVVSCPAGMDEEVWRALDEVTRREILWDRRSAVIEGSAPDIRACPDKKIRPLRSANSIAGKEVTPAEIVPEPTMSTDHAEDLQWSEDEEAWPDDEEGGVACVHCSSVIPEFALDDHVCVLYA